MIHNDTWYEVKTHWGWFRLDEGAYRDYLQGKLWITWKPGRPQEQQKIDGAVELMPTNISEEAVQLRDKAGRYPVFSGFDVLTTGSFTAPRFRMTPSFPHAFPLRGRCHGEAVTDEVSSPFFQGSLFQTMGISRASKSG